MSGSRGDHGGGAGGRGAAPRRPSSAARDAILDAYFDGDMDDAGRAALFDALRRDHALASEFARMTFVIDALARPAPAPDLTRRVLEETSRRTRGAAWLSGRARVWVRVGRLAAAACVLFALGVALVARRQAPDRVLDRPTPLTSVVEHGRVETAGALRGVAGAIDTAKAAARRLGAEAAAHPVAPLRPTLRDFDAVAVVYPAPPVDAADGPEYLAVAWAPEKPRVSTSRALWWRSDAATLPLPVAPAARDR